MKKLFALLLVLSLALVLPGAASAKKHHHKSIRVISRNKGIFL